jgi:DNA-binding beta-propeller fold protein YncE
MQVARTIDVPDGPAEIIVTPDGKRAYVACNYTKEVAEIDLGQWKVSRLIDAGAFADGMAWAQ